MKHYLSSRLKWFPIILLLTLFILGGCATVQESWNKLTPDQKARVVINDLQSQLDTLFNTGKTYVTSNPQYQDKWKKQIVPAFDVANKGLRSATELAKTGQITPDQVYAQIQPLINSTINLLISIGGAKKSQLLPDEFVFPEPKQAAMDYMLILALINGLVALAMQLWSSARKVFGTEVIPSWDEIISKNKTLQDKIDAEIQS